MLEHERIYPNSPEHMTRSQRARFVAEHREVSSVYTCTHGHMGCSVEIGGPCLDEVVAYMEAKGEETE